MTALGFALLLTGAMLVVREAHAPGGPASSDLQPRLLQVELALDAAHHLA